MILLGKYERTSRIHKDAVKTYRHSQLFSPCIGIGRDHARVPFTGKYIKGLWYVIIGSKQDYIDKNGFHKSSITPRCILGIPSLGKNKLFGKNSTQWYDLWRGCIFKPVKKWYNIHIKDDIFKYLNKSKYVYKITDGYNEYEMIGEYRARKMYHKLLEDDKMTPNKLSIIYYNRKGEFLGVPQFARFIYK